MDLEKVNQLETKITTELNSLKDRINKMSEDITLYSDIDGLKRQAEEKRKLLVAEKEELLSQRVTLKQDVGNLSSQYDAMKAQLQDNETYIQIGNLERKWQHLEQNNFAMKEYIAQKNAESDYGKIKDEIVLSAQQINQGIIKALNNAPRSGIN